MASRQRPGVHLAWVSVTYRSVLLAIMAVVLAFAAAMHFAFPEATEAGLKQANHLTLNLLERVAGAAQPLDKPAGAAPQKAHFTNLDGAVRVKKANSNAWINADYNVPLDKGDVVQTSSEGMAKVVFGDGTNYTVKQDSLIVIEDNSSNENQQTSVAVTVNTGTVDLSTGTYTQGSKSQVMVAGATASLAPESAAMVRNDPKGDQHEILLKKGAGDITRNGETVRLADWEKVSFQQASPHMARAHEVGPPTPISPANMAPIFASAGEVRSVEFSWTKMVNASSYRLRVSRNPYFSSLVVDRKVEKPEVEIAGLAEGAYYWTVQSQDTEGRESVESEKNRFTIIPRGKNIEAAMTLELDPFVQHGHVLEVMGKTEAGARVMVNGREVPMINADGTFHYFTPRLPVGESVITITAQNAQGGVNTRQQRVVIQ